MESKRHRVSVIVGSYRPDREKLRLTLRSILLQRESDYEIIVADDGSEENYFTEIARYLDARGMHDYRLVTYGENRGIVANMWQAISVASGDYVRLTSPGDYMHGFHALRDWTRFMDDHPDTAMSFCDAIYYHREGAKIVPTSEYAHPQDTKGFRGGDSLRAYLINDDICLGAAIMCRREVMSKYLRMLRGKVTWAEDNSYRLMAYFGEKIRYFPETAILYEYGTGISTNGSDVWSQRIQADWRAANAIMLAGTSPIADKAHVPELLRMYGQRGLRARLKRICLSPSRTLFHLRTRLRPRRSPCRMDESFITELLAHDDVS